MGSAFVIFYVFPPALFAGFCADKSPGRHFSQVLLPCRREQDAEVLISVDAWRRNVHDARLKAF